MGDTATTAARTIARETRQDKGNAATTARYHSNGGDEVNSNGDGNNKGSAEMKAGYRSNGGGIKKDDSNGNSGENGECGSNNRGRSSYLSLIFFVRLRTHMVMRFIFLLNG